MASPVKVGGTALASPAKGGGTTVPIASYAESARARYASGGVQFIRHELLGTVPINRSGLGVSGYHVHEVVASIQADGLSRRRYRDAAVVRVPAQRMDEFRAFNKRMCEGDDLLPGFSPEMRYAVLTKNHFVHALKLFDAASAFLHGTREIIRPNPVDVQLAQHLAEGVVCEVFREELWLEDPDAMAAIVGEDNMDAVTNLAASEIEVLQSLRRSLTNTPRELDAEGRFLAVMSHASAQFGNMAFSAADMANLYNYACRLPETLVDNLCQVHFAVVPAALLRVRPADFGTVAKLATTMPYVKMALIISLYLGAIEAGGGALRRQPGGVTAFASSLKKDTADKITKDVLMQERAEAFLKALLKHYTIDMSVALAKAVLNCRARLFHRVGKMIQAWPRTPFAVATALAKIEGKYAQELLESRAFSKPPQRLFAEPEMVKTVASPKRVGAKKKPRLTDELEVYVEEALEPSASSAPAAFAPKVSASAEASVSAPLVFAYALPSEGFQRLEPPPWDGRSALLWLRLVQQGLLHLHMRKKASADMVEVSVLEAADPVVYQARTLSAVGVGHLTLIPFVDVAPSPLQDIEKWRRPKTLHPHLPFMATFLGGAPSLEDGARFGVKSPLASAASPPSVAPAPFWAALAAQAETDANLQVTTCSVAFSPDLGSCDVPAKGRGRGKKRAANAAPVLQVDIPVLTNFKPLERGEVLVFKGSPADLIQPSPTGFAIDGCEATT